MTLLLRLAALCPCCKRRPSLRVTERQVLLARQCEPDEELQSVQCQRCGMKYMLAAVAFQHAEIDRSREAA